MFVWQKDSDRKLQYQQHRLRVQNAKSIVNSQAPQRKLKENAFVKDLSFIEQMACMQRPGKPRTFTKSPDILQKRPHSCMNTRQQRHCYNVTSHQSMMLQRSSDHEETKKEYNYDIPEHVLQRYEHLTVQRNFDLLRKLLRPMIYLDMEEKGSRPLGRIIIQLFTEACPEVVLEFVRVCSLGSHKRFNFMRLFPPLWLEAELRLTDKKTLTSLNIEHDINSIDHGWGPGIVSFPSRYVRGTKLRSLSFSISFKPLSVFNGKRIAFGKVRRGQWILEAIQDYATNNGKPLKEIVVMECGVMK